MLKASYITITLKRHKKRIIANKGIFRNIQTKATLYIYKIYANLLYQEWARIDICISEQSNYRMKYTYLEQTHV